MHTEPRTGPITKIGVHTNEGPEGENSAAGLAGYLLANGADGGGYQVTFDNRHTIDVQPDSIVCWANGGVNHESIDGCFVGYARQTAAEWDDLFSRGELEQAAQWVAKKCVQYGIPAVRLTPAQLHDPNAKGVFGHCDVTAAGFPNANGHTDPGPNFPWAKFLARVNEIITPPIDWKALARLVAWKKRVSAHPLHEGDESKDVSTLKALLTNHGYAVGNLSPLYGGHLVDAVAAWKLAEQLSNHDGTVFGAEAANALL